MPDCDILIIGAGVIGLACAARLASPSCNVVIVDAETTFGCHTSSRNSEVIHAGLYYRPGSLKAVLCREGRERLHAWCRHYDVPHRTLGKLLVAVEERERSELDNLMNNARACDVNDLQPLDRHQLSRLEPALHAVSALLSPGTGIIDSHAFMQSLLAFASRRGAQLVLRTRIDQLRRAGHDWVVEGVSSGEPFTLKAASIINAAGLQAQAVAAHCDELPSALIPPLYLCQGRYFSYSKPSPFSRLIYPVPEANTCGLGIHATVDMAGQLRFGPDVNYLKHIDYRIDDQPKKQFIRAISRYFPGVSDEALSPAYSGIRPKLSGPEQTAADFVIQAEKDHGLPGLVNLFGIESPGLTASLAIAERVAASF